MAHFINKVVNSNFSGSGTFTTAGNTVINPVESGTVKFTVTHNSNGSVTGTAFSTGAEDPVNPA